MNVQATGIATVDRVTAIYNPGAAHNSSAIFAGDQYVEMRQAGFASDEVGVMRISLLCEAVVRRKKRE